MRTVPPLQHTRDEGRKKFSYFVEAEEEGSKKFSYFVGAGREGRNFLPPSFLKFDHVRAWGTQRNPAPKLKN